MKYLPKEVLQQLQEAAKRPIGTFEFTYTTESNLFDPAVKGGIIFELAAGKHYFRLERNDNAEVLYYYSSPGTGTRVASIDLKKMKPSNKVFFAFTWSPEETNLHIGSKIEGGKLFSAKGKISNKKFQVGEGGHVVQIGDEGMEVMGIRVNTGGKQIIKPTAISAWTETKKAIGILSKGESKEGYIFDTVKANLSIVMMVTGFEAYCKTRFQEIEDEGIQANYEKIEEKLSKVKENFQDFNGYCKNIYKYGYGIKFSELVNSQEFFSLKRLFIFRGRIVHVSPLIGAVNELESPREKPVFSTSIVCESFELFDKFINKLHSETLKLRRKD
ncbi:MAG: hypothetical protein ABIH84_01565 [bacterium]